MKAKVVHLVTYRLLKQRDKYTCDKVESQAENQWYDTREEFSFYGEFVSESIFTAQRSPQNISSNKLTL